MNNSDEYIIANGVLIQYTGHSQAVTIPEGVTSIGENAFSLCDQLESVTLPKSVTSISRYAFSFCGNLQSVTIPDGVTSIGENAFTNCSNLRLMTVPESVTSIGDGAFHGCTGLADGDGFVIILGKLFEYFGSSAFVNIPEGVTSIENFAFSNSRVLKAVTIPQSVTSIGCNAFFQCSRLQSVTIPESVTSIGDKAFYGCAGLADEGGMIIIRGILYGYCGRATSVTIPAGVTSIGAHAFFDCTSLKSVAISEGVTSIGEFAFYNCHRLQSVAIPEGVTSVGDYAFYDCSDLHTVIIPESMTAIGERIFAYCSCVSKLTVPVHLGAVIVEMLDLCDDLRIRIPDLSVLPVKFRICAALCFAEDGGHPEDPRFESHGKYIKANAEKLRNIAANHLDLLALLCREKWIKAKDVEAFLTAVQQAGNTEAVAMILDYQTNKLTDKEKERAAKQKEKQEETVFARAVARASRGGIAGRYFVISGHTITFQNRKEAKAFLESKGAKLQTALSAKTDYLIMNDIDSDTVKKHKAQELGIEIISEEQFNILAGRRF